MGLAAWLAATIFAVALVDRGTSIFYPGTADDGMAVVQIRNMVIAPNGTIPKSATRHRDRDAATANSNITSAAASNATANSTYPFPTYGLPSRQNLMIRLSFVLPIVVVVFFAASKMRTVYNNSSGGLDMDAMKLGEFSVALFLFVVSGPAVIILNKHIMKDHHFHFPITLASLGNLLMMVLSRAMVASKAVTLENTSMEWGRYLKVVVLMAVMNFFTQVLGMWAYLFVSVPEIQILKSITVVLVMAFATIFLKEPYSPLLVISVFVIAAGTCLSAVFDEGNGRIVGSKTSAQVIGVLLCIVASCGEAAKTICSQILMDSLKVFDGVYWSSPAFSALAVIFVVALEMKRLVNHPFTGGLVGLLVLNAFLTSLIVLSSFWVVKLTGALTMKVITQARTVALVLVSVAFFHEHCSAMQYLGYAVSLLGIAMFDKAKTSIPKPQK